MKLKIL